MKKVGNIGEDWQQLDNSSQGDRRIFIQEEYRRDATDQQWTNKGGKSASVGGFQNSNPEKWSMDQIHHPKTGDSSQENFGYMYQYISRKYSRIDSEFEAADQRPE